jgi:hypothetical protein
MPLPAPVASAAEFAASDLAAAELAQLGVEFIGPWCSRRLSRARSRAIGSAMPTMPPLDAE